MKKIAYLYTGMNRGGAQKVLIDLADRIREEGFESIVISDSGELSNEINKRNIKHFIAPLKNKEIKFFLKSLYIIRNTVKCENVSIIHSHHRYTTALAIMATIFTKTKIVHTEHNVFPNKNTFNFRGKNIICVSDKVKKSLIDNGVNKKYISLIYNGIDTRKKGIVHDLRSELKIEKDCILIGVLARLVEEKGHKILLEALSMVKSKSDKFKVVFIGDGPEKKNLLELIHKLKLRDNVILLGNRVDVEEIIECFSFFILPSYFEGLPMSILECMSKSKIVVATNVGGNNEIIRDGKNGFLIECGEKVQLANKIEYCIDNLNIVRELGINASKTIGERFSINTFIDEHKKYYNNI